MKEIQTHYESILGPVYSWMMGGVDAGLETNRHFFAAHSIEPRGCANALDLGAGSGFQTIPLAERGFAVTAVDLSATLTGELRARTQGLAIRALERDLLPVTSLVDEPQELVVCAGDTLTHLADQDSVAALVAGAAQVLEEGGRLVLTWRELGDLPRGDRRFLPVRSSPDRIFTCFLEAIDDAHVRVTDLVHVRSNGGFEQSVGSYTKLRVSGAQVDALLAEHGFVVEAGAVENGLTARVARRADGGVPRRGCRPVTGAPLT